MFSKAFTLPEKKKKAKTPVEGRGQTAPSRRVYSTTRHLYTEQTALKPPSAHCADAYSVRGHGDNHTEPAGLLWTDREAGRLSTERRLTYKSHDEQFAQEQEEVRHFVQDGHPVWGGGGGVKDSSRTCWE